MPHHWIADLSADAIRRTVGDEAYARGAAYLREGRVLHVSAATEQILMARVRGNAGNTYTTLVTAAAARPGALPAWSGHCSCPMQANCKHVAAAVLAARRLPGAAGQPGIGPSLADWAGSARGSPSAGPAGWEWQLAAVMDAAPDSAGADDGAPLALQFEVITPKAQQYPRYDRIVAPTPERQRVRMRPVVRGKSGRWVRTGASWRDLQYGYGRPPLAPAHRSALLELHRLARSERRPYYGYDDSPVYLDECTARLWPLLAEVSDAGVEAVDVSGRPVVFSQQAVAASLDVTASGTAGSVCLQAGLRHGDVVLPREAVRYIGEPAHGIFVAGAATPAGPQLLLAPLDRVLGKEILGLLEAGRVDIPADDVQRFRHSYLPRLRRIIEVGSSDGSVSVPVVAPPRLALAVAHRPGHEIELDWGFHYQVDERVQRVPARTIGDGTAGSAGLRDPAAERKLLNELTLPREAAAMLTADIGGRAMLLPQQRLVGMDTVAFLRDVLPVLVDAGVQVEQSGTPADYRLADAAPLITVSVADADGTDNEGGRDWFDLGVTVSVGGENVPFAPLFTTMAQGGTHLLLDSGTYFSLDQPELEQLRRLIEEARALQDKPSAGLRISPYQAGLWEELVSLGVVGSQSRRWERTVTGLLELDAMPAPDPPAGLVADLRPYQLTGYQWLSFLWQHDLGGILADDMGLGKTVQTLAAICARKQDGLLTAPVLVVAPTSVMANWVHEAAVFAPGLRVVMIGETDRRRAEPLAEMVADADIVVTSYALFRIDFDAYSALAWAALVLDEAQAVKNHLAKTYQCARRLAAPVKIAITGTPLENNLMELWALLSIVAPGMFPHPQRFADFYRKPIERGTDPALLTSLRRRIRPLMVRRTKDQVATDLPPKQEQILQVPLGPRHRRIYATHLQRERQKILGLIDDMQRNRFQILRSLTLLRRLALDPALIDEKYAGVGSAKVDALIEQLSEVAGEGHRALVFSQFTGFLRIVRDRLDAEGIGYCYLDGRTRDRAARVAEFKEGTDPLFLISLKAGGFGLNLTEADYVFVLDPWWNPAVEAQAVDRTHRIGQDKKVMVYRLVATDTIEEKVVALQARKRDLFARVVDEGGLMAAPLSVDDIKGLLD